MCEEQYTPDNFIDVTVWKVLERIAIQGKKTPDPSEASASESTPKNRRRSNNSKSTAPETTSNVEGK
jgi:hypothetical protein